MIPRKINRITPRSLFLVMAAVTTLTACGGEAENNDTPPDNNPIPVDQCYAPNVICGDVCIDPMTSKPFCGADAACQNYTACGNDQTCNHGQCEDTIADELCKTTGFVRCGDTCIDPMTSSQYCGANAHCENYQSCTVTESCQEGRCKPSSQDDPEHACKTVGFIKCNETCINPLTSNAYCGANENCENYTTCKETESCLNGRCHPTTCESDEHRYNDACEKDSLEHCGEHGFACAQKVEGWKSGTCVEHTCKLSKCISGKHLYQNTCEDDSSQHCGEHDLSCASQVDGWGDGTCENGQCVVSECLFGKHLYQNSCEDDSILNCGGHNTACASKLSGWSDGTCENGQCRVSTCQDGLHIYENTCESNDAENCGDHGVSCKTEITGWETGSCLQGKCRVSTCIKGMHTDNNTCEYDDANNCGLKGRSCSKVVTGWKNGGCAEGECQLLQCIDDFHVSENTCVADTQTCCGVSCSECTGGKTCSNGQCVVPCPNTNEEYCTNACVNIQTNPLHCGACDHNCDSEKPEHAKTMTCQANKCQLSACEPGFYVDGSSCKPDTVNHCGPEATDCTSSEGWKKGECNQGVCQATECNDNYHLYTDDNSTWCEPDNSLNCGAHDNACLNSTICIEASCLCSDGELYDFDNDSANCGECSHTCDIGKLCQNKVCVPSTGNTLCNGVQVDTSNDAANCGQCARVCDTNQECLQGECKPVCDPNTHTLCGINDDLCCDNATEVCLYDTCLPKGKTCESANHCGFDEFCEESSHTCVKYDDNPNVCKVVPTSMFTPRLQWHWPIDENGGVPATYPEYVQVMMTPTVINLTDDNGDGRIDENDIPDVIFIAFKNNKYNEPSVLRVLSGDTGKELAATDPLFHGAADVGAADIDNDGIPEIVVSSATQIQAYVLSKDHNATTGYVLRVKYVIDHGGNTLSQPFISFADLEGDGIVDIATRYGVVNVINGQFAWREGCQKTLENIIPADLDGDTVMELVGANNIYDANCNVLVDSLPGGYLAIAELMPNSEDAARTGELKPEIVTVKSGSWDRGSLSFFKIYKKNGSWSVLKAWEAPIPIDKVQAQTFGCTEVDHPNTRCTSGGGTPVIADFDGDAIPDIGVATRYYYIVYSVYGYGGKVLWADAKINDLASGATGSSAFDFDGDGKAEVVYADEQSLRIYDGSGSGIDQDSDNYPDPTVLFTTPNSSGTLFEYPVVVDVDNDGSSEIIVAASNYLISTVTGVRAFEDPMGQWARTRRIWNQHSYHVTNINEDGSVPIHEEPNWLNPKLNNYRQNVSLFNAAPNLVAKGLTYESNLPIILKATVANSGSLDVRPGVPVRFYVRNADGQGHTGYIGEARVNTILRQGSEGTATIRWDGTATVDVQTVNVSFPATIYYVIDEPNDEIPYGHFVECSEDDNRSQDYTVN